MRGIWLVLILALAPRLGAAAESFACPAEITTPIGAGAVPGWVAVPLPATRSFPHRGPDAPGRKRFARLSLVDGLPADFDREAMAVLMPDEGAGGPLQPPLLRQRWDLGGGGAQGFLMVCSYAGTATLLYRAVPGGMRECVQLIPVNARRELGEASRSGICS
jgi:hypothetical protein